MRNARLAFGAVITLMTACSAGRNAPVDGTWQLADSQQTKVEFRPGGVAMFLTMDKGRQKLAYRFTDERTLEFTAEGGTRHALWTNVRVGKDRIRYVLEGETEERVAKRAS